MIFLLQNPDLFDILLSFCCVCGITRNAYTLGRPTMRYVRAVEQYLEHCKTELQLSRRTIEDKGRHLQLFCFEKISDITLAEIHKQIDLTDKTDIRKWRIRIDFRSFLRYLNENNLCDLTFTRLRNKEPIIQRRAIVTEEEFKKMDEVIHKLNKTPTDHNKNYIKWHSILHFLYETGLRRTELSHLRVCDLDNSQHTFTCMTAKAGHVRTGFYITDLSEYLASFRPKKHVFNISKREISHIILTLRKMAGIDKQITAHSFRVAYITRLLENGASLQDTALLAGHRKLDSTLHYFRETDLKGKYQQFFKTPKTLELSTSVGKRNKLKVKFQITKY